MLGLRLRLAVACAALAVAATMFPGVAFGWTDIASAPATAASGHPFSVDIHWDGGYGEEAGSAYVVAEKASTHATLTFPVHPGDGDDEGNPTFEADVTLPSGGDWTLVAREFDELNGAGTSSDSDPVEVSCDPLPLLVRSTTNPSGARYGTPAKLVGTVARPDGTPVASATVELLCLDDAAPRVVGVFQTDASGTVSALVTHSRTYEPYEERLWAWRVKGTETNGSLLGKSTKTTIKKILDRGLWGTGTRTGKIQLVAGKTYQFYSFNGAGGSKATFTLKSSSGATILSLPVRDAKKKNFTVKKTGTYSWKMRVYAGYATGWNIW
jgi:hypothetical protein